MKKAFFFVCGVFVLLACNSNRKVIKDGELGVSPDSIDFTVDDEGWDFYDSTQQKWMGPNGTRLNREGIGPQDGDYHYKGIFFDFDRWGHRIDRKTGKMYGIGWKLDD